MGKMDDHGREHASAFRGGEGKQQAEAKEIRPAPEGEMERREQGGTDDGRPDRGQGALQQGIDIRTKAQLLEYGGEHANEKAGDPRIPVGKQVDGGIRHDRGLLEEEVMVERVHGEHRHQHPQRHQEPRGHQPLRAEGLADQAEITEGDPEADDGHGARTQEDVPRAERLLVAEQQVRPGRYEQRQEIKQASLVGAGRA